MTSFKTAAEAISWIHSRRVFGPRPGLLRIEALLKMLDNPEKGQQFIHIAGTNGKGSTTKFLTNLLQEIGLNVGSFTSPFIEKFNERIQLNGEFIPDEDLLSLVNQILPFVEKLDQDPKLTGITEFEVNTVLGFLYFKNRADVSVIEVGLGGLLDSTNVIEPLFSGITTIGFDHTEILGDTLEKIAFQKAGIIKKGRPVVLGNIPEKAKKVIEEEALKKASPIYELGKDYTFSFEKDLPFGEKFSYEFENHKLDHLKISLIGHHQVENASLALTLFFLYTKQKQLKVNEKEVKTALEKTFWPARMEILNQEPLIILDGAHNDHAVKRLVENLKTRFKGRKLWILYSALKSKDIHEMLADLKTIPNASIVITTFKHPKALETSDLNQLSEAGYRVYSMWQDALVSITQEMDEEDVLVVTGSLYFSSEVRPLFKEE